MRPPPRVGPGRPSVAAAITAIAKWFRGKELSFAFGVNLTIARPALRRPQRPRLGRRPPTRTGSGRSSSASGSPPLRHRGPSSTGSRESGAEALYDLRRGEHGQGRLGGPLPLRHRRSGWWSAVHHLLTRRSSVPDLRREVLHGGPRHEPRDGGFLSSLLTLFAMVFSRCSGLLVTRWGSGRSS